MKLETVAKPIRHHENQNADRSQGIRSTERSILVAQFSAALRTAFPVSLSIAGTGSISSSEVICAI